MGQKEKHLEMIQEIIKRIANNSFFIKGWAITLVAGLLALLSKDPSFAYAVIIFIPVAFLWCLDAYFISQERLFRDLYESVRKLKDEEIDYSMDVTQFRKKKRNSWLCSFFSHTLIPFYLSLIATIYFILLILF